MYEILLKNHKSIKLNSKQFQFLKIIGQLGFLNYSQLTMLWSVVKRTYSNFSHSMLKKWITQYQLLKIRPIQKRTPSELSRPVYYVSAFGMRLLSKYHVTYVPMKYLNFNSHNEQCTEVTIQALFKAAFDVDLINNPNQFPLDKDLNHLIASSSFDLDSLDLRPWSKQIKNYKAYPFVPDQLISFNRNGRRCEIMIELDNRTEDNVIQIQKIYNYMLYAKQNPQKQILMNIAITDGALPNFKFKQRKSLHNKVNHLLNKFNNSTVAHKYSLASLYRNTNNLLVTIAGVGEAHVDIADFINNKNFTNFSISTLRALAYSLAKKFGKKIVFQSNPKLQKTNFDFFGTQGTLLGHMIYSHKPIIYQPVILGYEHSLDTFINLTTYIPQNCIYVFPPRDHKLLTPSITKFYQKQLGQAVFSHQQGMIYQPMLENNINPNLLFQLLFTKNHYYRYLYNFFTTGTISASDKTNYIKLTYLNSSCYPLVNRYLQPYQSVLQDTSPRNYMKLQQIAFRSTPKEFASQLNVQDIPLEVLHAIFHQIPIKAFSSPYNSTLYNNSFDPIKYLYLPDAINPIKRTKISF